MICSQCGTENQAGDKFCEQCGAPLGAPDSEPDGGFAGGFSATVMAGPAAPSVLVRLDENGEQAYPLGSRAVIGRLDTCDVPINDKSVSREHARLSRLRDGYVIEDLGSTNGTLVNGRRIDEAVILHPGDIVTVGSIDFRFDIEGSGAGQDDAAGGWKTEAMPTPTTWSFPSDAASQSLDTWRAAQSSAAEAPQTAEQEQPEDGQPVAFPPLEPFAAPPPVHDAFGGPEAVEFTSEAPTAPMTDGTGEQPEAVATSIEAPSAQEEAAPEAQEASAPVAQDVPAQEASAPVVQEMATQDVSAPVVQEMATQDVSAPVAPQAPAPAAPPPTSRMSVDDTTEMAEQLTGLIQDLARQLREARTERDALQQRIPTLEEAGAARTSVRQSLQNLPSAAVSTESVQSLSGLLGSLAQSPRDIELLMQVAARASDLAAMVNDYIQLQGTVDDIAGHVGLRPAQ